MKKYLAGSIAFLLLLLWVALSHVSSVKKENEAIQKKLEGARMAEEIGLKINEAQRRVREEAEDAKAERDRRPPGSRPDGTFGGMRQH